MTRILAALILAVGAARLRFLALVCHFACWDTRIAADVPPEDAAGRIGVLAGRVDGAAAGELMRAISPKENTERLRCTSGPRGALRRDSRVLG